MGNAALEAFSFLIGMVFNLYAMLLALRFVMQMLRVEYYNPLAQFVVKITDPVLKPARRIIPSIRSYDTSSLLLAFAVLFVKLILLKAMQTDVLLAAGRGFSAIRLDYGTLFFIAIVDLVHLLFNIFIFSMIAQAILSWFPNPSTDAIRSLLMGITDPVLRPIRRFVPLVGGLDLSVLVGIIGMFFLQIFVTGSLLSPFV